jgi:predicted GIY-YIG superfamily endonuclease
MSDSAIPGDSTAPTYVCYTLVSANGRCTYVGITNCMARRLRQHNGELCGGAKYTTRRGGGWTVAWYVTGFRTKVEALQFEWALHHCRTGAGTAPSALQRRWSQLRQVCNKARWTSHAPPAADVPLCVQLSMDPPFVCAALPPHVTVTKKSG